MTTTRRGEILGERLSNAEDGRDFNEPTGRIYSLPVLVQEIHERLVPGKLPEAGLGLLLPAKHQP